MKYTLALASIVGIALVSSASAATISESAVAPSTDILTSQLTDLGPGSNDANRDYTDNGGPAAQTFQVASAASVTSLTIMGSGHSGGTWTSAGDQPFTGTEIWTIRIGRVNLDGSIDVLNGDETATGFTGAADIADYLTFSLDTAVAVVPGVTYVFGIDTSSGWLGHQASVGDSYAGGTAGNMNYSTVSVDDNSGGLRYKIYGDDFFAANPNGYDYVFSVNGGVPEPATAALLGLGGLALVAFRRRS